MLFYMLLESFRKATSKLFYFTYRVYFKLRMAIYGLKQALRSDFSCDISIPFCKHVIVTMHLFVYVDGQPFL